MVGTSLFIFPIYRTIGLAFLSVSVPLAYESVRRKISNRIMYVEANDHVVDHGTQKFWKQVKGLGSKLIVGIPSEKCTSASMVLNASASDSVDYVVTGTPKKVSLEFLDQIGAHYIVCSTAHSTIVTKEVAIAKRCLLIGIDGIVRPMEAKEQKNE